MKKQGNVGIIVLLLVVLFAGVYLAGKQKKQGSSLMGPGPSESQQNSTVTQTENVETNAGLSLLIISTTSGVVKDETFQVAGKTMAGADVAINDLDLKADAQGDFSAQVTLDEGENIINVVVNDDQGNYAEKEFTVTYNSPQTQQTSAFVTFI